MDDKRFSLWDIFKAMESLYDEAYESYEDYREHLNILEQAKKEIAERLGFKRVEKKKEDLNAFEKFLDTPVMEWVYTGKD